MRFKTQRLFGHSLDALRELGSSWVPSFVALLVVCSQSLAASEIILGELESPEQRIEQLFPTATRHEEHVRVIERTRGREVRELLPESISYHERGKRVVYSAYENNSPLGFLHVRNEISAWGVIEIAWELNLDLTVRDFTLLRCRDPQRKFIESERFHKLVRGGSLESLTKLLDGHGNLDVNSTPIPSQARDLCRVIIHSGLKCLSVTRVGWSLDISKSLIRDSATREFPAATEIAFESLVMTPAVFKALEEAGIPIPDTRTRSTLLMAHGLDAGGNRLASFVYVRTEFEQETRPLLFAISEGGVRSVTSFCAENDPEFESRLQRIPSKEFEELRDSLCPIAKLAAAAVCMVNTVAGGSDER